MRLPYVLLAHSGAFLAAIHGHVGPLPNPPPDLPGAGKRESAARSVTYFAGFRFKAICASCSAITVYAVERIDGNESTQRDESWAMLKLFEDTQVIPSPGKSGGGLGRGP